ncbi:MAG: hypothetical protein IJY77_01000 [Alphaproteobacteria bacterium]|nr:hypothetical protein [Alphaproteobacteria bacterium]
MTPEQLTWSDNQWAAHLGCAPAEMKYIKKLLADTFCASIVKYRTSHKYGFLLTRRHDTPSGFPRVIPVISSDVHFDTHSAAAKHANEQIIPKLELTSFWADTYGIPAQVLHMLHVNDRQK